VPPTPHASATTLVLEGVHDGATRKPIQGAQVKACLIADVGSDPDCGSPVGMGWTDGDGGVSLTFPTALGNVNSPTGPEIFLQLTATGYVPSWVYYPFPVSEATIVLSPANSMYMDTAAEFSGSGQDPALGSVYSVVADCLSDIAQGVKVGTSPDAGAPIYFEIAGTQVVQAAAAGGTTPFGIAAFNNVPVGSLTLTATPIALGKASSHATIYVHGGGPTAVVLYPN
jgi:hypothetical protein